MVALRAPVPAERSIAARSLAARLIQALRAELPEVLEFDGVDLGPATEQGLFHHFRRTGAGSRSGNHPLRSTARLLFAMGSSLAPRSLPTMRGAVLAIVTSPAHLAILKPIEAALQSADGPRVIRISDGMASAMPDIPRLTSFLDSARFGPVVGRYRMLRRAGRMMPDLWTDAVDRETAVTAAQVAGAELNRQTITVACLRSVFGRGPSVILAFDELGRRARLIGPSAARSGVASLDLPHAEAVDPIAIRGATYDRFGVFGPRARRVLVEAGIPDEKIREIGPARFDALIARPRASAVLPHRLVFAAQWLGGQMTPEVKRETIRIALQGAARAAPCELVIAPHPLEQDRIADEVLAAEHPAGVTARVERSQSLYDLLDGAWALLTGWSMSVFESLLAHVPAVCITATRTVPPTTFVEEGLALGATSVEEVGDVISQLHQPERRERILQDARLALVQHIGPLDGRSAQRSASLILELASRGDPSQPSSGAGR